MKNIVLLVFLVLLLIFVLPSGGTDFNRGEVSFKRDIRPIFSKSCATCHNPQGNLPLILEYPVAFDLRFGIKEKILTKKMPAFGGMTESERDEVLLWIELGAKK